jgi:hypothetical protein
MVQNPLAMGVLDGQFKEGDHIVVDAGEDGALTFKASPGSGARSGSGGPAGPGAPGSHPAAAGVA